MKYHSCKCSKKMPFLSVLLIKFLDACCLLLRNVESLNREIVESLCKPSAEAMRSLSLSNFASKREEKQNGP